MSYNYPDPDEELIPGGQWTPPGVPLPPRADLSLGGVAGQFNPATGGFGAISPQLISALRSMQANPQDQMILNNAIAEYKAPGSPTDPAPRPAGQQPNPIVKDWSPNDRWGR